MATPEGGPAFELPAPWVPRVCVVCKDGNHERRQRVFFCASSTLRYPVAKRNLGPTHIQAHRPGFAQKMKTVAAPMKSWKRACQHPDFVAIDPPGQHWLIETKGMESAEVSQKDAGASNWCENASSLTEVTCRYLKVPQKGFEVLKPRHLSDLAALRSADQSHLPASRRRELLICLTLRSNLLPTQSLSERLNSVVRTFCPIKDEESCP